MSNFWDSCPKKYDQFPRKNCLVGGSSCPWKVNSTQDNNCFWVLIRRFSKSDGSFEPLTQSQISELLAINPTKLPMLQKEILAELKISNDLKDISEIF